MTPEENQKAKDLIAILAPFSSPPKKAKKVSPKSNSLDFLDNLSGFPKSKMVFTESPSNEITPQEIASKLNTYPLSVDKGVIRGFPTDKELALAVIAEMRTFTGNDRLDISNIRNGENIARAVSKQQKFDMNDQRWHGGGSGGSSAGVSSLNGATGTLTIAGGTNISVTGVSTTITINNTLLGSTQTVGTEVWYGSSAVTLGTASFTGTTFIGQNAGKNASGADSSVFVGNGAGNGATSAILSSFIGNGAGNGATSAANSIFIGGTSGDSATGASKSIFIGFGSGNGASAASNSTLIGYQAGKTFTSNNIGTNNIIIGTNISLPDATTNSINIGGVIFGKNIYGTTTGNGAITATATGSIGIGVVPASITARLHLAAGTATASTAPLKFTSGTLLGTTEAGAVEFNGTHLYFTASNGGTRFQLDQQTTAGLTVGTSTISSGTSTRILYDNAGVLGEYTISGTGTTVAMATGASLITPTITSSTYIAGTATAGTAPIYFGTGGVLLSASAPQAVETTDTHIYWSDTSGNRWQLDQQSGGGITINNVTTTSATASINNGYITNNAGLVTITLPVTASIGSIVQVIGSGAGGWSLAQNSGQIVHVTTLGTTTTGVTGSVASKDRYDQIVLTCIVANTTWSGYTISNLTVT